MQLKNKDNCIYCYGDVYYHSEDQLIKCPWCGETLVVARFENELTRMKQTEEENEQIKAQLEEAEKEKQAADDRLFSALSNLDTIEEAQEEVKDLLWALRDESSRGTDTLGSTLRVLLSGQKGADGQLQLLQQLSDKLLRSQKDALAKLQAQNDIVMKLYEMDMDAQERQKLANDFMIWAQNIHAEDEEKLRHIARSSGSLLQGQKKISDNVDKLRQEASRLQQDIKNFEGKWESARLQKIHQLYRLAANHQRDMLFDKAEEFYQEVLTEGGEDAEVYWRLLMCHYCLSYQKDEGGRQIPIILNPDLTDPAEMSIRTELQHALANTSEITPARRVVYEDQLEKIDRILDSYRQVRHQQQYDVFISVKQTRDGRQTADSDKASDLYDHLSRKGLQVFNSRRVDLPAGQEYEPYIISALMSARVLIVVGSCPENMNAQWVKNEWSRFQWLQKNEIRRTGKTDRLLLCYLTHGMQPHQIPKALNPSLQAICEDVHADARLSKALQPILDQKKAKEAKKTNGQVRGAAAAPSVNPAPQPHQATEQHQPQETVDEILDEMTVWLLTGDYEMVTAKYTRIKTVKPYMYAPQLHLHALCAMHQAEDMDQLARSEINLGREGLFRLAQKFGKGTSLADELSHWLEINQAVRKEAAGKAAESRQVVQEETAGPAAEPSMQLGRADAAPKQTEEKPAAAPIAQAKPAAAPKTQTKPSSGTKAQTTTGTAQTAKGEKCPVCGYRHSSSGGENQRTCPVCGYVYAKAAEKEESPQMTDVEKFVRKALDGKDPELTPILISPLNGKGRACSVRPGMELDRGFIANSRIDSIRLNKPYIFITDFVICEEKTMQDIFSLIAPTKKELLIIATDVIGSAMETLKRKEKEVPCAAILAPGYGDRRIDILRDIAVKTGGTAIITGDSKILPKLTTDMLGQASLAFVDKGRTILVTDVAFSDAVDERIREVRASYEKSASDFDREKLKERMDQLGNRVIMMSIGHQIRESAEADIEKVQQALLRLCGRQAFNLPSQDAAKAAEQEAVSARPKKDWTCPVCGYIKTLAEGEKKIECPICGYSYTEKTIEPPQKKEAAAESHTIHVYSMDDVPGESGKKGDPWKTVRTIVVEDGVKELKIDAFSHLDSLETVVLPFSLQRIGYAAFQDCKKLNHVFIPGTVTTIAAHAFDGCRSLDDIVIPNSVTYIGDSAFSRCPIKNIKVSQNCVVGGGNFGIVKKKPGEAKTKTEPEKPSSTTNIPVNKEGKWKKAACPHCGRIKPFTAGTKISKCRWCGHAFDPRKFVVEK